MGAQGLGSRAIIGKYFAALEAYAGQAWVTQLAMLFGSDQASETYKWLGMAPVLREWIGGRLAKGFRENGITIVNKKWEATLQVLVDEIRRDKTGQVQIRIDDMAARTIEHDAKLLSTLIANGTGDSSGLCYDGQYYFDDDHSEGDSGTQKNLLTATEVTQLDVTTAAAPTASEAIKAILGVIAHMMTYKDDQGEPVNADAREFTVMTAPALWSYLTPAVVSQQVASGETNVIKELAKDGYKVSIVCNPRLTYTTQFVTFRADAPAKPFIIQEEEGLTISAQAEGSAEEFNNDRYLYGVKRISNVGYGLWYYAAHSTLS